MAIGRLQRRRHARHRHLQPGRQHGQRAARQRRRHIPARRRPSPPARPPGVSRSADLTGDGRARHRHRQPGQTTRRACSSATATAPSPSGRSNPPPPPSSRPFQVGRWPTSNGDGIPDIVTANRSDNSVSVLLGNPRRLVPDAGRPSPPAGCRSRWRWPTSTATASPTSSPPTTTAPTVSVLMGNGDGTFRPYLQPPRRQRPVRRQGGRPDRRRHRRHRRHQQERQHGRRASSATATAPSSRWRPTRSPPGRTRSWWPT